MQNMGLFDRLIRIIVAIGVAVAWKMGLIGGTLAIVLLAAAGVFVLTSLIGFCPLYTVLGLSTRGSKG